jgi:hypothetical protein
MDHPDTKWCLQAIEDILKEVVGTTQTSTTQKYTTDKELTTTVDHTDSTDLHQATECHLPTTTRWK